jgi:putative nucleotidyltransferase with HDIG domain
MEKHQKRMTMRVDIQDLTVGMYVSELDRPWLETPFLFQGFEVKDDADIEELGKYCKFVFIDADQSRPGSLAQVRSQVAANISKEEVDPTRDKKIEFEILKKSVAPKQTQTYQDITTIEEEVDRISATYRFTHGLITEIMADARLGKSINLGSVKEVVTELAESVIRNPDALTCYSQLKNHDQYTAEHSLRVSILAMVFGRHLGMEKAQLQLLGTGGLLHDVGKMKIPLEILNKPSELTRAEATIMEDHVPFGVSILENSGGIADPAMEVVRGHHERYDGTGYKYGLKADTIGQFGLIGGIVDFYDAVTSDRCYRKGIAAHVMLREMYKLRGQAFDPTLVEQFIQCIGVYPIGSVVELNSGDVGVVTNVNRDRRLKPKIRLILKPNSKPYTTAKIIDLTKDRSEKGKLFDIGAVVEAEKYHINPHKFLPTAKEA